MDDERRQNGGSWENEKAGDSSVGQDNEGLLPSWARREQIGYFQAIIRTIKEVLWEPQRTFGRMQLADYSMDSMETFVGISMKRSLKESLKFTMIVGTINCLLTFGFSEILTSERAKRGIEPWASMDHTDSLIMLAIAAPFIPFLIAANVALLTAFQHAFLQFFRASKNGFEATFRVVCYTFGAFFPVWTATIGLSSVYIIMDLRIVGYVIGLLCKYWPLVCVYIGLREVHQTNPRRIALAVFLLPLLSEILSLIVWYNMKDTFDAARMAGGF